jgi:hypothetical protein
LSSLAKKKHCFDETSRECAASNCKSAGVIFFNFQKLSAEMSGVAELNIVQKEWLAIVPYLLSLKFQRVPPVPKSYWRRCCYAIATHDRFEYIILFLVCVNVVEMCVWWYGMDAEALRIKENINLVLSALFAV